MGKKSNKFSNNYKEIIIRIKVANIYN